MNKTWTARQIVLTAAVSAALIIPIGCASHNATTTTTVGSSTGEMVNPDGSVTTSTTVTTASVKDTNPPDWSAHQPSAKSNTNPANDTGTIVNKDDGGKIGVDHLSSDFANNTRGDTALHEKGNVPRSNTVKVASRTTSSTNTIGTTDTTGSVAIGTTDTAAPDWNAQNPPLSTSASTNSGTVVNEDNGGVIGVDHTSSDFANNPKGDTANSTTSTYSETTGTSGSGDMGTTTGTTTTNHRSVRGMHHRREKKE
jgi:hypothetical protein